MHAADATPRESVGQLLRMTRAQHGVDLPHVAEALRIRLAFLQAIEDGRSQDLPGPTYAVGFVRAYAEYLGLDGNEIARRYKDESAIAPRRADLEFPTPVSEGGLPTGAVLLMAALLGAGIYGGWYWLSSEDRTVASLIQEVPERFDALLASTVDTPVAPGADQPPSATDPRAEASAPEEVAAGTETPVTLPDPAPEAQAEQAEPPAAAEPAPAAGPDENVAAVEPAPEAPEPAAAAPEAAEPPPVPAAEEAPAAEEPEPVETAEATPQEPVSDPEPAEPAAAVEEPAPEAETAGQAPAPEAERVPEERQVAVAPTAEPTVPPPPPPPPEVEEEMAAVPEAPELPEAAAVTDGTVYGAPAGSTRVVLAATADSWIQVRAGEELVATRLLRKGERFQVPDREDLTLMVGNAGGLQIQVDGRPLPRLGDIGEVRRGIRLEPAALLSQR